MEMRWFDWDRELVEKAMPILSSSSINLLYDFYKKEVKIDKSVKKLHSI